MEGKPIGNLRGEGGDEGGGGDGGGRKGRGRGWKEG